MNGWRVRLLGFVAMGALAFVASCDNGPSAVETRERGSEASVDFESRDYASRDRRGGEEKSWERGDSRDERGRDDDRRGGRDGDRTRDEATPTFEGKPLWSSTRKYSATQNAAYHYRRNGKDFGARSVDAYVERAHAFVSKPPRGTLRLTRRNGDKLFYDPASNTFAVATRQGAPRTMFKPEDGMEYWQRQVEREERGGRSRQARRDDEGGRGRERDSDRG